MAIRRALAFPLYCVAFALHLMTAMMSALSAKVAGDDDDGNWIASDRPRGIPLIFHLTPGDAADSSPREN